MPAVTPITQDSAVASAQHAFDRLLFAGESQTLEFKTSFDKATVETLVPWDAYPALHASVDALSPGKIERFVQQVNSGGRFALDAATPLQALEKLHYIQQGQPTWAAMLLFAQEPLRHHIHIGRFKTPDMIIDDRQITDTLFEDRKSVV